MILNAYAVLDWFVVVLRFGSALLIVSLGLTAWRRYGRVGAREVDPTAWENRSYLLFLLAFLLLALNLVSWPLLYLMLQSFVPQWPGVMCIYGVTQIGAGSIGASRFLPDLVAVLQGMKPVIVFLSGAWIVLYRINRQTRSSPLMGRIVGLQVLLGVLALADATVEAAYLAIPKAESHLSVGCCTAALNETTRRASALATDSITGPEGRRWLGTAFYAINGGMIVALGTSLARARRRGIAPPLKILLCGVVVAVPVTLAFLVDIVAPAVLHLPYHHCLYDLIPKAPDMVFGIVLFVWGSFSVGWACVARWLANRPTLGPVVEVEQNKLLAMGFNCYLGSLIVTSIDLYLA